MRQKVSFSKKSAIKVSNANDQPVLRGFICNWIRLDQVLGIFVPLVPQDMKQMIFRAASNAFLTSVKLILSENQTKCGSTVKRERGENKKYVAKILIWEQFYGLQWKQQQSPSSLHVAPKMKIKIKMLFLKKRELTIKIQKVKNSCGLKFQSHFRPKLRSYFYCIDFFNQ